MARVAELHSALAPRTPVVAQQVAAADRAERHAVRDDAQRRGRRPDREPRRPAARPGAKMVALAAGRGRRRRAAARLQRLAAHRRVPLRHAGRPGPGPWCAYFTSWAAKESGVPLGNSGQGFGRVDDVYAWAQSAGKANPVGSGQPPQPGDLIVWDEHIGIVESVAADGSIQTIEGNSSDKVSRRNYGKDGGGAIGFVRMSYGPSGAVRTVRPVNGLTAAKGLRRSVEGAGGVMRISVPALGDAFGRGKLTSRARTGIEQVLSKAGLEVVPSLNDPGNDGWVTLRIAQPSSGPPAASSPEGPRLLEVRPQRHLKPRAVPRRRARVPRAGAARPRPRLARREPARPRHRRHADVGDAPDVALRAGERRPPGRRLHPGGAADARGDAHPRARPAPADRRLARERRPGPPSATARTSGRSSSPAAPPATARRPGERDRPPVPRRPGPAPRRAAAPRDGVYAGRHRRGLSASSGRALKSIASRHSSACTRWAGRSQTAASSAAAIAPKRRQRLLHRRQRLRRRAAAARTAASTSATAGGAVDLPPRTRPRAARVSRSAAERLDDRVGLQVDAKRSTFMPATSRASATSASGLSARRPSTVSASRRRRRYGPVEALLGRRLDRQARRVRALGRRVEPQPPVDRHPARGGRVADHGLQSASGRRNTAREPAIT